MKGRIRDDDVQEVRRRSNLVDVAAEYMQVRRAGRQFRALCPFHSEKTPSFYMDPAKQLYNCHGCHEGGDVITLVEKLENLSFVEAIERLARRAGFELRYEQLSDSDRKAFRRRARLIDAHRAAVEWYHAVLLTDDAASDARTYLKSRGFGKETAVQFRIGFSKPGLASALKRQGFTDAELSDAGLASRAPDGSLSDRFRNRVMFPIFDVTGEPVAFGARRMRDTDQGPKYLNSAESPIYKKAHMLYALNWAKGEVVKSGRAVLVEGYTDVIALHQAGITEAVATCGTALGLEHLRTLQRFLGEKGQFVFALDMDDAGQAASEKTFEQFASWAEDLRVLFRIARMPSGKDPADAIATLGPDGFRALVEDAPPLLEVALRREAERYNVGDPELRARALAACVRLLSRSSYHLAVRDEYARRLSDWIRVDPNVLFLELNKAEQTGVAPKAVADSVLKRSSGQVRLEKEALRIAIHDPVLAKQSADDVDPAFFSVPAHRAIWTALASGSDPASSDDADVRKAYTSLAVQAPEGEVNERQATEVFARLKGAVLTRQVDDLKQELQRLNPIEEKNTYDLLFVRLIDLEREKRALLKPDDEVEEDG
ncbi:MAG: DNA primase [Actinobacteria bacterium]|nr:DNA primase [Actinomycetota bacterium]